MPEKSGIDAALCAPELAGAAVGANCCAEARVIAATVASNRKCRCIFMSTSPSWSTHDARPHEVAVPSILYQNRNRRAAGRYTDEGVANWVASRSRLAGGRRQRAARSPSAKLCFRLRKKGYFVLLKWWGRCVGNTTRAATLDSMREVPTWPHAPPAPWPLDTTLASGGNAVGSLRRP